MDGIANYQRERAAFAALWEACCKQRVLLYRGQSGCGKTTLLRTCRQAIPDTVHQLFFDLKHADTSVLQIFYNATDRLGWDNLPCFQQELKVLNISALGQVDNNQLRGNHNLISQVINIGNVEERRDRQVHLTDAWLQDVQALDKSLLLVIDTYEQAIEEVKIWLKHLLTRMPYNPNLRLVLAGQTVPDAEACAEEWTDHCQIYDLYGVKEAEHWLPVVEQLGRVFPPDITEPQSFLAGICMATEGRPAEIVKWIKTLPQQQG